MGENNTKKGGKDFIYVGLALFAMFFGAGNLIFPPDLGVKSGPLWFLGFICFLLADAGLAVLGVIAMGKVDGDINNITGPLGKHAAVILNTVVIICIGPGIAIPRTCTVSYGLGIAPVFGIAEDAKWPLALWAVIFFLITLFLTIKPSKVVDIVGKVLTPFLVVTLLILIIIGMINPGAHIGEAVDGFNGAYVVKYGISQGYQTMDGMASLFFGIIVISAIRNNGYTEKQEISKQVLKSSVIAGVLLFITYGGLSYLGASTGQLWKGDVVAKSIDQAGLVTNIIFHLMGKPGLVILGIAVTLACLTTAIGLTSSAADYFSSFAKTEEKQEKIYKIGVIVICLISGLLANLGLAQIISIAGPILSLVYPVVVFLLIASLFRSKMRKRSAFALGALGAFITSIFSVFAKANHGFFGVEVEAFDFVTKLPFNDFGFNWVVPAVVLMIIGCLIPSEEVKQLEK